MKDWEARRVRYQRDSPVVQIGGLASNLSRIAWLAHGERRQEALPIFLESKYFTEWVAPSCPLEQQGILAELQLQLSWWERAWGKRVDPSGIAREAQQWSTRLLESAGLLRK
jgi:hypothetical protein